MPAGDYLLGLACFAALLTATLGGAWLLLRKRFGDLSGSPAAVAAIVLFAFAFARDQLVLAPGSIDILNFHLPGVGRWIQTGSLWDVHNWVADTAAGNYPNNGDLVLLAAVLPWHSDFLSHLVPYAYYALTGLGVYAVAVEAGAPRAAAATAACLVLALPVVALPALANSFPDTIATE